MPVLTFRMGAAFPAGDPIARWVLTLSLALGDLRIAADYAVREDQPAHERIYFVRIMASHLREVCKLLILDHRERDDIRAFVSTLSQEARDARQEAERRFEGTHALRPDDTLFQDMKIIRDDTFHYARDAASQARLEAAMRAVADMQGTYR